MTKSKGMTKLKGHKVKTNNLDSKDCDNRTNTKTDGDVIVSTHSTAIESGGVVYKTSLQLPRTNESSTVIPRGKPKSGRVWKTTRTQRYNRIRSSASWAIIGYPLNCTCVSARGHHSQRRGIRVIRPLFLDESSVSAIVEVLPTCVRMGPNQPYLQRVPTTCNPTIFLRLRLMNIINMLGNI